MRSAAAMMVVAAIGGVASAQMPAGVQRVEGSVAALTAADIAIAKADGTTVSIPLLPTRTVTIASPIAVEQIQPGSHVATANKSQPDGTGVSIELRVFPPETAPADVNRVMSEADQTMMTNGRVATAVSSGGGRMLTVDYGAGSRQIMVPPTIQVISNRPGTWDMIKVGSKVTVANFPATGERPARQSVTIAGTGSAS